MLVERAKAFNIPLSSIQGYVDSFKHGALPHGGGGIGLERGIVYRVYVCMNEGTHLISVMDVKW